jgi:hypothetical protein
MKKKNEKKTYLGLEIALPRLPSRASPPTLPMVVFAKFALRRGNPSTCTERVRWNTSYWDCCHCCGWGCAGRGRRWGREYVVAKDRRLSYAGNVTSRYFLWHPPPDMESIWQRNYGNCLLPVLLPKDILHFRDLSFVDILRLYILAYFCSHRVKFEWALAFPTWTSWSDNKRSW